MSDYRRWCNHCNENITFGDCGCEKSKEAKKKIQEQFKEEDRKRHEELVLAKEYLLNIGFKIHTKEAYDFKKEIWTKDPEEIKKLWINNDKHNLIDYVSMVKFIKELQNPKSNVLPGTDI